LRKIRVEEGVPNELTASLGVKGSASQREGYAGGQGLTHENGNMNVDDPDD
jgi:hypothetical protein